MDSRNKKRKESSLFKWTTSMIEAFSRREFLSIERMLTMKQHARLNFDQGDAIVSHAMAVMQNLFNEQKSPYGERVLCMINLSIDRNSLRENCSSQVDSLSV